MIRHASINNTCSRVGLVQREKSEMSRAGRRRRAAKSHRSQCYASESLTAWPRRVFTRSASAPSPNTTFPVFPLTGDHVCPGTYPSVSARFINGRTREVPRRHDNHSFIIFKFYYILCSVSPCLQATYLTSRHNTTLIYLSTLLTRARLTRTLYHNRYTSQPKLALQQQAEHFVTSSPVVTR